jgi:hypothetical protein
LHEDRSCDVVAPILRVRPAHNKNL